MVALLLYKKTMADGPETVLDGAIKNGGITMSEPISTPVQQEPTPGTGGELVDVVANSFQLNQQRFDVLGNMNFCA